MGSEFTFISGTVNNHSYFEGYFVVTGGTIHWNIHAICKDSTRLQENILNSNFACDCDKFKFRFP